MSITEEPKLTRGSCAEYALVDPSTIPYDIICNGFSLKETILEVLNRYETEGLLEYAEVIAEEIKEALAVKMRLKQG